MTICAILLAARRPNRTDCPRRVALAALAALCRPVVLTGGNENSGDVAGLPVDVIGDGSVAAGLRVALASAPNLDGAVFLRTSQSRARASTLAGICTCFRASRAAIVAASYDHTIGLPALFSRSLFEDLLALPPEGGPESLIAAHALQIVTIPLPQLGSEIESAEVLALL